MFGAFRSLSERFLRIPGAPDPPPGDEETTRLFRAAPNYYFYLLVTWTLRTIIVLAVLLPTEIIPFVDIFDESLERLERRLRVPTFQVPSVILVIAIVQRLFALAVIRLDFEKRWYLVTDRSLRVREGVLKIREMTITFANIQNIAISQGPIQRLLGIADLRVDTAGGGARTSKEEGKENLHGVHFRGVNNAEEIRELINRRLRELKDSGLGDLEERARPPMAAPNTIVLTGPLREVLAEVTALRRTIAR